VTPGAADGPSPDPRAAGRPRAGAAVVAPAAPPAVRVTRPAPGRRVRALAGHRVSRQLAILAGYLAAGVAVTWPRAGYLLSHRLPATRDAAAFVWGFR
jgi:hypothetical protein